MTESPTTLRATEQTLASPAFLTQLQPAASAAVSTSRWALLAAQATTSAGFSIARSATSLGFSGARAVVSALPGGVGVVGGVTLAAAEQAALFGIGIGQGFTDLVLGSASTLAASLNAVYGNDEALRTLAAFLELVQREWTTSLETDPYPEGGLSRWTLSDVGRAAATWSALQSVTAEWEGERVCAELEELDLATWGRGASEQKENEVVWEVTEEQLLETGEEVIQATIEGEEERRGPSTQDERTREHLKRFSRMALGTYGGVGALFFGPSILAIRFNSS